MTIHDAREHISRASSNLSKNNLPKDNDLAKKPPDEDLWKLVIQGFICNWCPFKGVIYEEMVILLVKLYPLMVAWSTPIHAWIKCSWLMPTVKTLVQTQPSWKLYRGAPPKSFGSCLSTKQAHWYELRTKMATPFMLLNHSKSVVERTMPKQLVKTSHHNMSIPQF